MAGLQSLDRSLRLQSPPRSARMATGEGGEAGTAKGSKASRSPGSRAGGMRVRISRSMSRQRFSYQRVRLQRAFGQHGHLFLGHFSIIRCISACSSSHLTKPFGASKSCASGCLRSKSLKTSVAFVSPTEFKTSMRSG